MSFFRALRLFPKTQAPQNSDETAECNCFFNHKKIQKKYSSMSLIAFLLQLILDNPKSNYGALGGFLKGIPPLVQEEVCLPSYFFLPTGTRSSCDCCICPEPTCTPLFSRIPTCCGARTAATTLFEACNLCVYMDLIRLIRAHSRLKMLQQNRLRKFSPLILTRSL